MRAQLADSFRKIVSGDPKGRPEWVGFIEEGNDAGLFGPLSGVWEVHGTVATLIGGIRALLLQAAHPAALAGVKSHSRYETDLMGRLQGTSRWMTLTTFASTDVLQREAARVNAMHSKVSGEYVKQNGVTDSYKASDPRFLLWVHCAFTESFLEAHLICRYRLNVGVDAYVKEWSASAVALGLTHAPQSYAELKQEIERFLNEELTYTPMTKEVVGFILNPPFGFFARLFYRPLAKSAIRSLSKSERALLHLAQPSKVWEMIARANLFLLSKALGNHSPAHEAALKRCAQIDAKS